MPYTSTFLRISPPANPANPCIGAYGINDLGQVVVYDCSSGGGIPYIWQNGTLTPLPQHPNAGPVGGGTLGGTFPLSISNSGAIVGYYADAGGVRHGFSYLPPAAPGALPTWTTYDHPLPARFEAGTQIETLMRGIPLGVAGTSLGITGLYEVPSAPYFAGTIEAAGRSVMDLNPADLWQDFDGGSDPVNGLLNSVVGDSGASTVAAGINDLGVIVGRRYAPFNDSFVYLGGSGIPGVCPLATAGGAALAACTPRFTTFSYNGYPTHALGISDGGDVVGWFNDPTNNGYGR
ncbi:MAG: hypothetical protein JO203_15785, partial [Gammaproteobacteria bacterium]|nr:hypothetical protein [Gammaproteobacteria bacterium]